MPIRRLFRLEEKTKKDPPAGEPPAQPPPTPLPDAGSPNREPDGGRTAEPKPVLEGDNRAARILRFSQAGEFWQQQEGRYLDLPFLRYVFDSELQARDALLAIDCIHLAEDTGHLVCTESITLGCYRMLDGRYEVFLAGDELSYATWSEAVRKFSDHRGQYRDQRKPEKDDRLKGRPSSAQQVIFEKEYYQIDPERTCFFQVFKAASAHAARTFLLRHENMITVRNRSIRVETPEAIFWRDFDGIHEMKSDSDPCQPEIVRPSG